MMSAGENLMPSWRNSSVFLKFVSVLYPKLSVKLRRDYGVNLVTRGRVSWGSYFHFYSQFRNKICNVDAGTVLVSVPLLIYAGFLYCHCTWRWTGQDSGIPLRAVVKPLPCPVLLVNSCIASLPI